MASLTTARSPAFPAARLFRRSRAIAAFLVLSASSAAFAAAPAPSGWWLFGEGSGETLPDASGHGLDGAIHSSLAVRDAAAPFGGALVFDGRDDAAVAGPGGLAFAPALPGGDFSGSFSIAFWTWVDGNGAFSPLVSSTSDADDFADGFAVYASGGLLGACAGDASGEVAQLAGPAAATNAWTHLCLTFDGAVSTPYADGLPLRPACLRHRPRDGGCLSPVRRPRRRPPLRRRALRPRRRRPVCAERRGRRRRRWRRRAATRRRPRLLPRKRRLRRRRDARRLGTCPRARPARPRRRRPRFRRRRRHQPPRVPDGAQPTRGRDGAAVASFHLHAFGVRPCPMTTKRRPAA